MSTITLQFPFSLICYPHSAKTSLDIIIIHHLNNLLPNTLKSLIFSFFLQPVKSAPCMNVLILLQYNCAKYEILKSWYKVMPSIVNSTLTAILLVFFSYIFYLCFWLIISNVATIMIVYIYIYTHTLLEGSPVCYHKENRNHQRCLPQCHTTMYVRMLDHLLLYIIIRNYMFL